MKKIILKKMASILFKLEGPDRENDIKFEELSIENDIKIIFDPKYYVSFFEPQEPFPKDPLKHYLRDGWRQGKEPSVLFDSKYYLSKYSNRIRGDRSPLVDFCLSGWKEGCRPHPLFDTSYYLLNYPTVKESGINPLVHYIKNASEGFKPHPLFDAMSYIYMYEGVKKTNKNPLIHYLLIGGFSKCNPVLYFDSDYYLSKYKDVRESGINPLVHYILNGCKEGKKTHPVYFFDKLYLEANRLEENQIPLAHYIGFEMPNPILSPYNYMNTDSFKRACEISAQPYSVVPDVDPHDLTMAYVVFHQEYLNKCQEAVSYYFNDGWRSAKVLADFVYKNLNYKEANRLDFLEFASGYGRLTRHLSQHLNINLTSCDIHNSAINFISNKLGIEAVVSSSNPDDFSLNQRFDMIFCLSFFTHMPHKTWGRWFNILFQHLRPGGTLIFTTHGKRCCELRGASVPESGLYFTAETEQIDLNTDDYGYTIVSEKYVDKTIRGVEGAKLEFFCENYYWDCQDIYAVRKIDKDLDLNP